MELGAETDKEGEMLFKYGTRVYRLSSPNMKGTVVNPLSYKMTDWPNQSLVLFDGGRYPMWVENSLLGTWATTTGPITPEQNRINGPAPWDKNWNGIPDYMER